jgi:ABC-type glutathione transport system ATPase component
MSTPLLSVRGLSIALGADARPASLVQDVSFDVSSGQILSIVGESGSGKSMTAKAIMGLLPPKASASGTAMFRGQNLLAKNASPAAWHRHWLDLSRTDDSADPSFDNRKSIDGSDGLPRPCKY